MIIAHERGGRLAAVIGMNSEYFGPQASENAHVIVCGNEKGGSGKTTTCMHIVVSLLKNGYKVATFDLDSRQKSLSRYVENRRRWSRDAGLELKIPDHFDIFLPSGDSRSEAEALEFGLFAQAMGKVEHSHDFIVIDTPGSDSYLMRLAHSMADTLITPMNDSFVDFDVLGWIDAESLKITGISHYAEMVREARRQRRAAGGGLLDWIVVRNRLSTLSSRNEVKLLNCLKDLSLELGFRIANGISERVIFREFFPIGLTALDDLDQDTLGARPTMSHLSARHEIRQLLEALRLPIDAKGQNRAKTRLAWLAAAEQPLELPDIFAE